MRGEAALLVRDASHLLSKPESEPNYKSLYGVDIGIFSQTINVLLSVEHPESGVFPG